MDKFNEALTGDEISEKSEEQLSILIDELTSPKRSAISELRAKNEEKKRESAADETQQKSADPDAQAPAVPLESAPAAEEQPVPEAAQKHLSDMEVIEHTANIWQYKEIVDDNTEQHAESHRKRSETAYGEIIAARVRGKKHKHEGTNCDDYFETAVTNDCFITAVCDGAGSKLFSRIGSRASAEAAVAFLKTELEKLFAGMPALKAGLSADLNSTEFMAACGRIAPLVQQSAREAYKAQQEELAKISENEAYASVLGRKPVIADLSTTFLAAVTVPLGMIDGKNQTFLACVQIGDGCICAVDSKAGAPACVKLMGEADSGAFSGETDFLSEKNIAPAAIGAKTRVSRGTSDVVMLMSDGVADDYFPAVPMIERLYLDLCLNGILPMAGELAEGEDPAPIRFRSVSVNQHSVALQYAKQLLSGNSEDEMNGLWAKREALRCHSLEAFRMNIGDTPEERLEVWLDNYNERGSFDDRTLVIIKLNNA